MRVLGIDPGIAATGYGVVEQARGEIRALDAGVIRTETGQPHSARLQTIYRGIRDLAERWCADAAAVEKLYFSANVRTAMTVGQARGVALLALADAGTTVNEYGPLTIKQAITGYGAADKAQVQEMVRMILSLEELPRPDDAADALAVAVCHLHSMNLSEELAVGADRL